MGNTLGNVENCMGNRKSESYLLSKRVSKESQLGAIVEKLVCQFSFFNISKYEEKIVYNILISRRTNILSTEPFFFLISTEAFYIIDAFTLEILKRVPLQYIVRSFLYSKYSCLILEHFEVKFKDPLLVFDKKCYNSLVEIPHPYWPEIIEQLNKVLKAKCERKIEIFNIHTRFDIKKDCLISNKNFYKEYQQLKNQLLQTIFKCSLDRLNIGRLYECEVPEYDGSGKTFICTTSSLFICLEKSVDGNVSIIDYFKIEEIANVFLAKNFSEFVIYLKDCVKRYNSRLSEEVLQYLKFHSESDLIVDIIPTSELSRLLNQAKTPRNKSLTENEIPKDIVVDENIYKTLNDLAYDTSDANSEEGQEWKKEVEEETTEKETQPETNLMEMEEISTCKISKTENPEETIYNIAFENLKTHSPPPSTYYSIAYQDHLIEGETLEIADLLRIAARRIKKLSNK